jgi:hypothetical protein
MTDIPTFNAIQRSSAEDLRITVQRDRYEPTDKRWLTSYIVREDDGGHYIISGRKHYITGHNVYEIGDEELYTFTVS